MIARLLTDLAGRVTAADAVATTDETISVARGTDGVFAITASESHQVQVRVVDRGRIGWAGAEGARGQEAVEGAIRAAAVGEPASLFLPAPSPVASVTTRSLAAGSQTARDLIGLVDQLTGRLQRPGWAVEGFAERSIGAVAVGNTRGVASEYPVSLSGIGATIISPGGRLAFRAHQAGAAPANDALIEALVEELDQVMGPPALGPRQLARSVKVWFAPRAVRALLAPLLWQLRGEAWLAGRRTWPILDDRLTLDDDPHAEGRPGARPIDDDGVPTRRIRLLDRGRATAGILDAAIGSRHLLPSTGHSWRRGPARPRIGFSNLVLAPGSATEAELAAATRDGVLVRHIRVGPAPNPETGGFRIGVPWAYRLAGGEVVGRLEDVVLSGNVFDLLAPGRVVAVGDDAQWIGAASLPSVVVDGVGAAVR
jgi:predicted Zn-dependent protease